MTSDAHKMIAIALIWSTVAFIGMTLERHPGYGLVTTSFIFVLLYCVERLIEGKSITISLNPDRMQANTFQPETIR